MPARATPPPESRALIEDALLDAEMDTVALLCRTYAIPRSLWIHCAEISPAFTMIAIDRRAALIRAARGVSLSAARAEAAEAFGMSAATVLSWRRRARRQAYARARAANAQSEHPTPAADSLMFEQSLRGGLT